MESIKDTVQSVIKGWDQDRCSKEKNPALLLTAVLSKKELRHAKANYFKAGVLSINVDSSSWLYHLGLKKDELLANLRTQGASVREIRFYLGEVNGKEKNKTR